MLESVARDTLFFIVILELSGFARAINDVNMPFAVSHYQGSFELWFSLSPSLLGRFPPRAFLT